MILRFYNQLARRVSPRSLPRFAGQLQTIFPAIQKHYVELINHNLSVIRPIDEISVDQQLLNKDKKWKAAFLYAYGNYNNNVIDHFPELKELIRNNDSIQLVLFSTLEPGKHIPPHKGRNIAVNRLQLGVDIKDPEHTVLRVADVEVRLHEGELFVFDDTFEHEAENKSAENRTVLIIDYAKKVPFLLRPLQKRYLYGISNSSYISDAVKSW